MTHAVDELGVVIVDAPDDLARQDLGLHAVVLGETEGIEDGLACGPRLGLLGEWISSSPKTRSMICMPGLTWSP